MAKVPNESVSEENLHCEGLGWACSKRNFRRQHASPRSKRAAGHVAQRDRGGLATAAHSRQVSTNDEP